MYPPKGRAGWVLLWSIIVSANTTQKPLNDYAPVLDSAFGTFVEGVLASDTIPGISMAVIRPDGGVELGGWGIRTEAGDPFEDTTLTAVASVSKAFVPAAMGIMMDDFAKGTNVTALPASIEVFDWDTKLTALLPDEWELDDRCATDGVNLRDLFAHHTGMPDHPHSHTRSETPKDIIARMKHLRSTSGIRHSWLYSNVMYMTGTHIIAKYSGMSYEDFVSERIFKPLGMKDSTYSPSQAEKTGRFSQSFTSHGRRIPRLINDEIADICAGGGGTITTAADLAQWLRMFLHQGVNPDTNTTVLPKSVYDAVIAPTSIVPALPGFMEVPVLNYGLGWLRNSYSGLDMIWHAGAIPGVSALVSFFPQINAGVVILANADSKSTSALRIGARVVKAILRQPLDDAKQGDATPAQKPKKEPTETERTPVTESLVQFAGRYTDPGYGTFDLCAAESDSDYCGAVAADFAVVDAVSKNASDRGSQLLGATDRVWSDHIRLVPRTGKPGKFNVHFTNLYPRGYGADATPFETVNMGRGQITAEFVIDEVKGEVIGFGLFGATGGATERMRTGKTVQERADAWFVKEHRDRAVAHEEL